MSDPAYEKAFNRTLRLLARRPRSTGELRACLLEKAISAEIVDRVLARLSELGYLNDEDFAYNYATSKLNVKAMGRERLRRTLVEKQVAPETIERALEQVFDEQDEEQLCERAVAKYLRIHGRPADAKQGRKLLAHLIRLGFSYTLAIKKVRMPITEEQEEME
ncbi:MAG: regulatory protein RecX [Acidobacteriota bacterium]